MFVSGPSDFFGAAGFFLPKPNRLKPPLGLDAGFALGPLGALGAPDLAGSGLAVGASASVCFTSAFLGPPGIGNLNAMGLLQC